MSYVRNVNNSTDCVFLMEKPTDGRTIWTDANQNHRNENDEYLSIGDVVSPVRKSSLADQARTPPIAPMIIYPYARVNLNAVIVRSKTARLDISEFRIFGAYRSSFRRLRQRTSTVPLGYDGGTGGVTGTADVRISRTNRRPPGITSPRSVIYRRLYVLRVV